MKITKRQLKMLIREASISPELEAKAKAEMGDYGPQPGETWDGQDYMTYLYELEEGLEYNDDPYEATVEYVKLRFPELANEIDELFCDGGARVMDPVFEAFDDMNDNEHPMASSPVLQGEEASFRVSDVKSEGGEEYRWWIWGNNLDPVPFDLDASGTDRDGRTWTAEEMFQEITAGKVSRFRVPKSLGHDLY